MEKNKIYVIIVVTALVITLIGGLQALDMINKQHIVPDTPDDGDTLDTAITENESFSMARAFVASSPTYTYDGEGLAHVKTTSLRCPWCWQFAFEFTCRHAGYGNRSKVVSLPVMTHHTAVITVMKGEITHAVLDGKWDMINQQYIT